MYLHCVKSVHIWSFSGPYFPVFGLDTERYGPKKFRMRTLFTQCSSLTKQLVLLDFNFWYALFSYKSTKRGDISLFLLSRTRNMIAWFMKTYLLEQSKVFISCALKMFSITSKYYWRSSKNTKIFYMTWFIP